MLPLIHRATFLIFAFACLGFGMRGFHRLGRRIAAGRADTDARTNRAGRRIWYAVRTTLGQRRTFRSRPVISLLHSWIFYGFVFYLLVNTLDAIDGFYPLSLRSPSFVFELYRLLADVLSALVLLAVVALLARRFFLPSRRDFLFNERTLLHEDVRNSYIVRDSLIVSLFIVFHVGSRAMEMGAKMAIVGPDRYQPFATFLSQWIAPLHATGWWIFGYWGALGSVLAFLAYFPYSKHVHIFMAPIKYAVAREVPSGTLPVLDPGLDFENEVIGAAKLEDLGWPRLLDAYACIQCNRCQDVCPATATGKSLSPSALEINKRMELNCLSREGTVFEDGGQSPRPLLEFALSYEAAWACTTCGACMQVCPVQDEPMLDIVDIRRHQVMMEGKFPVQLQTAFRGMERAKNPWGIAQENRLAWANGLNVKTADENPSADVLYWVGCAASYDPQAQKTARAFVQILESAGVNYAVLGKKECCTGDSARRAGNEFLYQQLAKQNIRTLAESSAKLIVATCPHCMNALGNEYKQLGGTFNVMHHTEYLDQLIHQGKLNVPQTMDKTLTFHDPCYLGRHNGVYDAPRNLLHVLSNDVRELGRNRDNSFCCGAGGAQFWKEEEDGAETISSNRFREAEQVLSAGSAEKVLAVGCPFCKSMLQSSSRPDAEPAVTVMDLAELLWDRMGREHTLTSLPIPASLPTADQKVLSRDDSEMILTQTTQSPAGAPAAPLNRLLGESPTPPLTFERKKWTPAHKGASPSEAAQPALDASHVSAEPDVIPPSSNAPSSHQLPATLPTERKKWPARRKTDSD